ncbi:MAG: DUF4435 domain-containing protein [Clostridia bacterium]|nr:DUF4435 domain-containing protein [Clostridia bacterium]
MSISITFPQRETVVLEKGKSMVILGANGAGKTRFAAKLEELNDKRYSPSLTGHDLLVQRISAQKSLTIEETISIFDLESAEKSLYVGSTGPYANKINYRYGGNPITGLLNDFNHVLSLLFAENNKQLEQEHAAMVKAQQQGIPYPAPSATVVDKASVIWNTLLPHRCIDLSKNGVHAKLAENSYHGKEMSDGERVMLYMICQVLVLKPGSVLVIDEPELHIHKAIVNKLWDALEEARQDCAFIYITHDLDFALSRNSERTLWIKSFNGTTWDYEFIEVADYDDFPTDLLYEIIGTRQKILFVEGDKNSYDHLLYQEIFGDKGYHVIPCGGCQDVVKYVKSKRGYEHLNPIEVYGIVDRDFRTDAEIAALQEDGVFCLDVAEVENLFVVPELLDIMAVQLGCDENAAQTAKSFISDLFSRTKNGQIGEAFIKEINHQMMVKKFEDKRLTPAEVKAQLDERFTEENISSVYLAITEKYDSATTIQEILRIFNLKDLSKKIGSKFGIANNAYPQRVINLLQHNPNGIRASMLDALAPYIPNLPDNAAE